MKHYSLSDSDMLGIHAEIDSVENGKDVSFFAVKATWNAILAQEGMSWDDLTSDNPLDIRGYAIPRDQMTEIAERIKTRAIALGVSSIEVTNLMLDFTVQYGPAFYENDLNN